MDYYNYFIKLFNNGNNINNNNYTEECKDFLLIHLITDAGIFFSYFILFYFYFFGVGADKIHKEVVNLCSLKLDKIKTVIYRRQRSSLMG